MRRLRIQPLGAANRFSYLGRLYYAPVLALALGLSRGGGNCQSRFTTVSRLQNANHAPMTMNPSHTLLRPSMTVPPVYALYLLSSEGDNDRFHRRMSAHVRRPGENNQVLPGHACPSENRNRTLYLRRMRLGTILAAAFDLASKLEATRIPRTFPLSSSAATSPM